MRRTFHQVAFGTGERRTRPVALLLVNNAQLVPGKRVLVILGNGSFQYRGRLLQIGLVFGCDQRVAKNSGNERLISGKLDRFAQRLDRISGLTRF